MTIGPQSDDKIHPKLSLVVDAARSEDIKHYDTSFGRSPSSHLQANGQQGSTSHHSNALTAPIAVYGGGASHIVKVQVVPIRRGAARGLIHGSEDRNNRVEMDQARGHYSPTLPPMSFLIIDAYTKAVASSPENHPIAVGAISAQIASHSGSNFPLNRTNPTVELIARAQRFDGSFPIDDSFIRLLTGSASAPSLPTDLTVLTGSEQKKQIIWVTMLALAVFAKNLPEDEVSWTMLAEKAEKSVRTSLDSLGVGAAFVTTMMNRLKSAAAKYVSYKFWFPIWKESDSSVIILVVSIDG